ncbi:MAG: T9SS type A sorting domain-containing protein [Bacteroidota bacterium]
MKTMMRCFGVVILVGMISTQLMGQWVKTQRVQNNLNLERMQKQMHRHAMNNSSISEKQIPIVQSIIKDDFLVSDDTAMMPIRSGYSSVGMDQIGNIVATWVDNRNDNDDIYMKRYSPDGIEFGKSTKVNDDAVLAQQWVPSVAVNKYGSFVIVWPDDRDGKQGIYMQRYTAEGKPVGRNVKVNDGSSVAPYVYSYPKVAIDQNGNVVVVWTDTRRTNGDPNDNKWDVYMQRYDALGIPQGKNICVHEDVSDPSIGIDSIGMFTVVWMSRINSPAENSDIYLQRYSSDGLPKGINVKVNDDGGNKYQGCPTISMIASGDFVVVWADLRNNPPVSGFEVYLQRFSSDGVARGNNIKVNGNFGNTGSPPSVTINQDRNVVVTWGEGDLYFQRYDSSGIAQGSPTKISSNSYRPGIVSDGKGDFIISWAKDYYWSTYFQRYSSLGSPLGNNIDINNEKRFASQTLPSIAINKTGTTLVTWLDGGEIPSGNESYNVYLQQFGADGSAQGKNKRICSYFDTSDYSRTANRLPIVVMNQTGKAIVAWTEYTDYEENVLFRNFNAQDGYMGNIHHAVMGIGSPSIPKIGEENIYVAGIREIKGWWFPIASDVYLYKYSPSLGKVIDSIKVNRDSAFCGSPKIVQNELGQGALSWSSYYGESKPHIFLQRLSSSGDTIGVAICVNTDTALTISEDPSLSIDPKGNIVVVWSDGRNGHIDIYLQRYDSLGVAIGQNLKINDDAGNADQITPNIEMDENGNYVIVWVDYRYGLMNPDIVAQRFHSDGTLWGSNFRVVADGPNYGELNPVVAANNNNIFFTWQDNRRYKGWDIYGKITSWDWDGIPNDVTKNIELPMSFALRQNFPNPFNPSTTISYSIPERSSVRLSIFNTLGQKISEIVNEVKDVGSYEQTFNASQLSSGISAKGARQPSVGLGYASGVYFYRIEATSTQNSGKIFVETKKMVLMR